MQIREFCAKKAMISPHQFTPGPSAAFRHIDVGRYMGALLSLRLGHIWGLSGRSTLGKDALPAIDDIP
ncbi:MAG: hypothetical protein AAFQ67_04545 [Pseudomonadota bacterium]